MLEIGMQTQNIVKDKNPQVGFQMMKAAGFSCCDFSLHYYLKNKSLYQCKVNDFFNRTDAELETFFTPHKKSAEAAGIRFNQIHMPYPTFVPNAPKELNDYLWKVVAPKSMKLCSFFDCKYIVVHGFKLRQLLGSEELEWQRTEEFLDYLAPMAKEMGIIICIENLYSSFAGRITEGPCCDARKAAERIDRLNEKYGTEIFGFCFDTGHANLVGLDFESFITTLGHRLKALHIHDNDGINDIHQIPFGFTRTRDNCPSTDWEGFIRGIRNIKYDGVLSFETSPALASFPSELKPELLQLMAGIGKHFAEGCGRQKQMLELKDKRENATYENIDYRCKGSAGV